MESDPPEADAAHQTCTVLLFRTEGRRGAGRFITTGVRWAESSSRKNNRGIYEKIGSTKATKIILNNDNDDKRMLFENCRLKAKRVVNPIVDWTDADVWAFLGDAKSPVNPLYAEGWCRVGCVGCPMAGTKGREREFLRWPKYQRMYINAFDRMLEERKRRGKLDGTWRAGVTGRDIFNWWMEYDILPGQMNLFDYPGMFDFVGEEDGNGEDWSD